VNTELSHRMNGLLRPAEALARAPIVEPEQTLRRFVPMIQNGFLNSSCGSAATKNCTIRRSRGSMRPRRRGSAPAAWS